MSTSASIFFILYVKPIRSLLIQRTQRDHRSGYLLKRFICKLKHQRSRVLEERRPGARFSKVPKFFGRISVTYFYLYLQSEGVSRHETLQLLYFLFPYNIWKGQLYRLCGSQFYSGFSGPKSLRGFRETGPWPGSRLVYYREWCCLDSKCFMIIVVNVVLQYKGMSKFPEMARLPRKFTRKPATLQQTAVSRSLRMHSLAFFETHVLSRQIFVLKYP